MSRDAEGSRALSHDDFERETVELLPELYAAALRLCKNEADAEDLVADAVAKAWDKLDTLRDPSSFRGWLFRILTNRFISCKRSDSARPVHEEYVEQGGGASFSLYDRLHAPILLWWGNPEQQFLDRLLREDFERAVDALPEEFRVVVVLAHVQGFSYREIAETLDVPIGTVRSRLARARARLQEALWEHAVDAGLVGGETAEKAKAQ
ncbi:MAG: sigma-70 family RNA polymerase sigma factor [Gemmatimonadota bacterium]